MRHCTNCGAPREGAANFCGNCGHRFADDPVPPAPEPDTAGAAPPVADTPHGGEMTAGAILLSLFMPFIALVVALVMRASELRPSRRSFLKGWAIGSAAWLCTGWIVVFFLVASITGSSSGGCKGGIDRFSVPSFQSPDGSHWTATYSCNGGGTKTVAYHGQVP